MPWMIIAAGCFISMVTFGPRSAFGLFTAPISAAYGWEREIFAFAVAVQNLLWGACQPFAGALADRMGAARVLAMGGILYAVGLALMSISDTPGMMYLSAGVLIGLGLAGASFTIVIGAFGKLVDESKRSAAIGMATAAGSLGQFLFAPIGQAFISSYGWSTAVLIIATALIFVPLLAIVLNAPTVGSTNSGWAEMSLRDTIRRAFSHRSYQLLVAGFFVCGFQIAFITVHLPPYLVERGAAPSLASWAIALVGLFNVVGAYSSGLLGAHYSKRMLLSINYLARALLVAVFILLPLSTLSVILFSATIGLLWLSTVPPTSGLVAVMFGTRYLTTLFGVVFFSHQVGAFIGVWMGGYLYDKTGSYDGVWWMGVALGVIAALLHWPIAERAAPEFERQPNLASNPASAD
jgi:MFS family permease